MKYVKLVSRPDEWYVPGTEVWNYDDDRRITESEWEDMAPTAIVRGMRQTVLTNEIKIFGEGVRVDGESCCRSEFDVEIVEDDGREVIAELKTTATLKPPYTRLS